MNLIVVSGSARPERQSHQVAEEIMRRLEAKGHSCTMFDVMELNFPLLAGSSLPVTWRLPDVELPLGCTIEEALMVGVGISDPMDYHAL